MQDFISEVVDLYTLKHHPLRFKPTILIHGSAAGGGTMHQVIKDSFPDQFTKGNK